MHSRLLRDQEDLVGLIYDAVVHPEAWQTWLDKLVSCAGARSALLMIRNPDGLDTGFAVQSGLDDALRELYSRESRAPDRTRGTGRTRRANAHSSSARVEQSQSTTSGVHRDICRSFGNERGSGVCISSDGPWSLRFVLQRDESQGEFSENEIEDLRKLVPHIRRSVQLGHEVGLVRGSVEAIVERLPTPCLLLDGTRRAIAVNSGARQLLEERRHGLVLKQDRVFIEVPGLTRRLQALIRNSHGTVGAADGQGGGIIKLTRQDHLPLILSVSPFRSPVAAAFPKCDDVVALLLYDPERRLLPNDQLLLEVFGLTRGEARVAILLAAGRDLEDIARALGVSLNAVKFHLKSIYAKTATHRQSEVVSLLLCCQMQTLA